MLRQGRKSKLRADQVRRMRQQRRDGKTFRAIAAENGVSAMAAYYAVMGFAHKRVKENE